jgi:TRAP-type C4-dicarboxylate transport system permease small subunit
VARQALAAAARALNATASALNAAASGAAAAGVIALLALSLAVVTDVLMRWLFRSPILAVADLAPLATAAAVAACFPAAVAQRQHIAVTALGERIGGRTHRLLELGAAFGVLAFFGLAAWQLALHAGAIAAANETTLVLRIPTGPAWWLVAGLVGFAAICAAVDAVDRALAAARG